MDPSYEEMLHQTLPPAEARIAINEDRAHAADRLRDPEHLRKELVGIFFEMRSGIKRIGFNQMNFDHGYGTNRGATHRSDVRI